MLLELYVVRFRSELLKFFFLSVCVCFLCVLFVLCYLCLCVTLLLLVTRLLTQHIIIIIIIIIIIMLLLLLLSSSSLVTGLSFLALLVNQRLSPPIRLQVSDCSIFRIMCDVPSIVVFCSESIEYFHGMTSTFFLNFLLLFRCLQLLPV
jgi:hypothetical protein